MKKPRGKILALSTIAIGLVVLVAAGILSKDRILEKWYLHQLRTGPAIIIDYVLEDLAMVGSEEAFIELSESGRRLNDPILEALSRIDKRTRAYRRLSGILKYIKDPWWVPLFVERFSRGEPRYEYYPRILQAAALADTAHALLSEDLFERQMAVNCLACYDQVAPWRRSQRSRRLSRIRTV